MLFVSPQSLYDVSTLNRVGAIARKLNITWGDWVRNIGRPHFEVKANWLMPKGGYKLEGKINVPTNSKMQQRLASK
ncbi:hypothetical protein [Lysinibacillus parviboronicapiens]|uniref:hypothetical protein n=1 Tax=Lysinibacillus parviboronicapiens TaxID=436516 RepID=UPI000D3AF131|nr:hypothetical protein [Lysinibacillus parviboronicapiens]